MKTTVTESPEDAASFIRRGEVVAFPTETVYGLGADIFNEDAVGKVFEAKRRPADNPLIAHIASVEQISILTSSVSAPASELIASFFPGPLTIVLPKNEKVPLIASGGLPTIGVRMPRHSVARDFLMACGTPLVAPSANISGRPSPTTWEAVYEDLNGRVACILKGEATELGLESTVVDCSGHWPIVLRPGAVSLEDLQRVVPQTRVSVEGAEDVKKSPGTRYRHYAPRARVLLVDGPPDSVEPGAAFIGFTGPANGSAFRFVELVPDVETYARSIFRFFRKCDSAGVPTIYCQRVSENGLGVALMDRLKRAAEA
jgi:L-threonylcarbamoyladenylate synthase